LNHGPFFGPFVPQTFNTQTLFFINILDLICVSFFGDISSPRLKASSSLATRLEARSKFLAEAAEKKRAEEEEFVKQKEVPHVFLHSNLISLFSSLLLAFLQKIYLQLMHFFFKETILHILQQEELAQSQEGGIMGSMMGGMEGMMGHTFFTISSCKILLDLFLSCHILELSNDIIILLGMMPMRKRGKPTRASGPGGFRR